MSWCCNEMRLRGSWEWAIIFWMCEGLNHWEPEGKLRQPAPRMASNVPQILVFILFGCFLPFCSRTDLCDQQNMAKISNMSLLQNCGFCSAHFLILYPSLSLIMYCGESLIVNSLQSEELNSPVNNNMSDLRTRFLSPTQLCNSSQHLDWSLMRQPETQSSSEATPGLLICRNCEINGLQATKIWRNLLMHP